MDPAASPKKLSRHDFEFIERIGKGAYGRVVRAVRIGTNQNFAIKIIEKQLLTREGMTRQALAERNILTKLKEHPGIVKLFYTFQDEANLYFVLEYIGGGELLNIINRYNDCFPAPLARFYTAQLVNILEFMHAKKITHRDLKPENILINEVGQLKLIDFGTAKDNNEEVKHSSSSSERSRGQSFVGTADYVSPEMLASAPITHSVDLWALGCIMFHLF